VIPGSLILATALASGPVPSPVHCPPPPANWAAADDPPHMVDLSNTIGIKRGRLTWNGVAIERETLHKYLALLATMVPPLFTVIEAAPDADCELLEAVRADVAAALPCDMGVCGEGLGNPPSTAARVRPGKQIKR
jgi:hypothetical protein